MSNEGEGAPPGAEGLDWEDLYYATNFKFWQEIQRRRERPTLSHDEVWEGRFDE